jgi:hypothetical protein
VIHRTAISSPATSTSRLADVLWPEAPSASNRASSRWLVFLGVTLLGYALFGKGWAYVGVPPCLFIGEILLLCGVGTVLFRGRFDGVSDYPSFLLLAAMGVWGTLRTLPYLGIYGAEALRDAVIWGYGAFAVVVYAYLTADPMRLPALIRYYKRFCVIYLPMVPIGWALGRYFQGSIPNWPWADVPIVDAKGGDVLVHLGGILAFWSAGLAGNIPRWRAAILAVCIAGVGIYSRAGLLAVFLVFAYCMLLRPAQPVLWRMITSAVIACVVLAVTDVRVTIPGKDRDISFNQVLLNVTSIIGESDDESMSGTKEWRLNWWKDICNYTINGPYRWSGKGFGINLADDDGYQGTQWEGKLRSPHNGHMTVLARSGVPGLAIWILIQLAWAHTMLKEYVRSTILKQRPWSNLFMFIGGVWIAFLVNASFDVYLEGPMGGIWFWTIIGVGLAAVQIYRTRPEVLMDSTAAVLPPGKSS